MTFVSVQIAILVDNATSSDSIKAEHGLALMLSGPGRKVLFDTGATGQTLLANAAAMGLDLRDVEAVVLSHGHHDHTGGLLAAAEASGALEVYASSSLWRRRWAGDQLLTIAAADAYTPSRRHTSSTSS